MMLNTFWSLIFFSIKLLGKSTIKKKLGKTTSKQKNPTLNIKTSDMLCLFFFSRQFITSNLQSIDA